VCELDVDITVKKLSTSYLQALLKCRKCLLHCLKKVPTSKLAVILSNLNRFSKFLYCCKAYEICYKTHATSLTSP